MPATKRTVRKVQTSQVADFDDQLWPINCAILILAGFVTGVVIATSKFDDPRILYNGWARLASVAAMVGLLFWGVMWLQGRMLRRLQLCLLLSLLVHLCLAVYFHERFLALVADWEAKSQDQVIEEYQQITLPDYHWQQIEQPHVQQSFEQPIETEAPQPTDPQSVRRRAEQPDIPAQKAPSEEPEVPQRQQPNPAIRRRAQLSAPRRADAAAGAQVSRQPLKDRPSPNEPIPEPEIAPPSRQVAAVPDRTVAPRPQTEIPLRVDRMRVAEEPVEGRAEPLEAALPQRAARKQRPAQAPRASTPDRQSNPLALIPPTREITPEAVERVRPLPTAAPKPSATVAARQQADSPRVVRPGLNPTPVTPDASGAVAVAGTRAPRVESTDSSARPSRVVPPRRLAEPAMPTEQASPRSEAVAVRAAPTEDVGEPIARPTTSAVSRGAGRVAQAVQELAAGRALPSINNTAELPAAVADRRNSPSQRQPAGSQTASARPSSLARSGRGVNLPSTAIAVESQPAVSPAAAGGTPASRLPLASEAAVLRSAGNPSVGRQAAASAADFAIESSAVVARTGQPRASGLQRSSPTASAPARRIARAAGPAAATAAAGIAEASPALPGAVATGPSTSRVPSLNVESSAARRGGTVRPFALQAEVGAGPAGSSGTSGPVGVAQSSRVTRHESIASAVAGGGTPKPGRTIGGDIAPNALAEASEPSVAAAGGGRASDAAPWQAQVSGPRRQISGLPGQLQSQPMAGALASLADQGAPLAAAAARRGVASPQESGKSGLGSSRSATLRRSKSGTDLPAAAVPVENVSQAGAGGVAAAQGGLPSSLQTGPNATVRQTAADLPVGRQTAAAGTAESALGSAAAVVMAGRVRVVDQRVPTPGSSAATRRIDRTAAAGPTLDASASLRAEPVAEISGGGPAAEADRFSQPVAEAAATGAARDSGRLPAVPAELASDASPGDAAVATAELGPTSQADAMMSAAGRRAANGAGPGSATAGPLDRGLRRTTDTAGLVAAVAEASDLATAAAADGSQPERVQPAVAVIDEAGRGEGGLPVQIAAVEGPGGLGYLPSPEVGIPSRRARPESEIIHTIFKRFVVERSGGELAIDGQVRPQPTEPFRQRDPGRRAEVAQAWGGSEGTEKAVEMGLDYFARNQFADGHWSLDELPKGIHYEDAALGQMESDSAATGLALLSYLGAGYTHLDHKYSGVVGRGIDWLLRHQEPSGELFTGGTKYARFYSHGIASIALCEAYGMTRDPQLREPARKAIEFIIRTQHPTRGGWRYDLHPETGRSTETDTSVSGWMLMAMKSAQMAGLDVPPEVIEKVNTWLDAAQATGADGQYVYNPHARDTREQRAGRRPSLAMTSEAMLMRMYLGEDRKDPELIAGADHLKENLPEVGTPSKPLRDCYYWYYATQAMFQMRADYWTAWNDRLHPLATSSQVQSGELAGSWHPLRPVEDRWGRAGGRHYVTALHLLMLEVYYRHLPLFQELAE